MSLLHAMGLLLIALLSPLLLAVSFIGLALTDLCFKLCGQKRLPVNRSPRLHAASIVIPNWNGRDLLERYLPSVIEAAAGDPENEIIVVDNASTDGSADYIAKAFPAVRVIRATRNLGFGGGSNLGFREARNDIVVLLNSDMRVEPDFLSPLLEPFSDSAVFSVSCQIFFSDATKRREETGLTQGWWEAGRFRFSHRVDDQVQDVFPCFYGGGGSSAYDRAKFLELGGFDELLRPFYYEDTDLGYMAWKRGWKVLYHPRSVVYHEHRGTIGKKFSATYIQGVLKKNAVLMHWKNIHSQRLLVSHFFQCFLSSFSALLTGSRPGSFSFPGLGRAFLQLPQAMGARWKAHQLSSVSDHEALRRPWGGYFRDRFLAAHDPVPDQLRVLFVAPYAIEPPVHGGAVFMRLTLEELAPLASVHVAGMVDRKCQVEAQQALLQFCESVEFIVRPHLREKRPASLTPHSVREFANADLEWLIHRTIYQAGIDVLQLEYTMFAQYAGDYRHIPCLLFEHDIYFQSIGRGLARKKNIGLRLQASLEYLRALRYELRALRRVSRVQVCSQANADYLLQFAPDMKDKLDTNNRAGISTRQYRFVTTSRQPGTLLFVGSFGHEPNAEGLRWFVQEVLPLIVVRDPSVRLIVVGSDPPPGLSILIGHPNITLTGYVDDIRQPFETYAVFICPILSGSGVRVKLLEAFASGMPSVSTRLGAEGLAHESGEFCELGDQPQEFADAVLHLLADEGYAQALARRARQMVEAEKDAKVITSRLERTYRNEVLRKRPGGVPVVRTLDQRPERVQV